MNGVPLSLGGESILYICFTVFAPLPTYIFLEKNQIRGKLTFPVFIDMNSNRKMRNKRFLKYPISKCEKLIVFFFLSPFAGCYLFETKLINTFKLRCKYLFFIMNTIIETIGFKYNFWFIFRANIRNLILQLLDRESGKTVKWSGIFWVREKPGNVSKFIF